MPPALAWPAASRVLRPLRGPDFRYLWLGQLTSAAGNVVQSVALSWLVLELTGSALALGGVLVASTVPGSLMTLAGRRSGLGDVGCGGHEVHRRAVPAGAVPVVGRRRRGRRDRHADPAWSHRRSSRRRTPWTTVSFVGAGGLMLAAALAGLATPSLRHLDAPPPSPRCG